MANDCLPQVQACRIRVSRLGLDGVPLPGATNLYVSDALVSLAFAWQVVTGDEIADKNACGVEKVNYRDDDNIRRGDVTINIITPDPELSELFGGGDVLTAGAAVGLAAPPLGAITSDPISVELWTKRIRNGRLDPTFPYAWWAYPWIDHLRPDNHEHSNKNFASQFVGEAYENPNWFNGPLNDWPATSDRAYQWIPTAYIPPASCGYETLNAS